MSPPPAIIGRMTDDELEKCLAEQHRRSKVMAASTRTAPTFRPRSDVATTTETYDPPMPDLGLCPVCNMPVNDEDAVIMNLLDGNDEPRSVHPVCIHSAAAIGYMLSNSA